jgi:hypothetical protein
MRGKKKKSIEELETGLEQLIANSGRSKVDIHSDYIVYRALKKRIDNPNSRHYDDDIRWMKDLHDDYLLGMTICNSQNKINAARKVAAAAATAIATSNVTNISISTSASTLIIVTKSQPALSRPLLHHLILLLLHLCPPLMR